MRRSKKWIALVLTCAMVFTTLIGSAFAADVADVYTENVPDSITEDMGKGILSGSTAAANTTELSILGINVTSTDSAGVLNAMSNASAPLNLLVFGSDLNEAPDPYLYNYYYGLAANNFVLPENPDPEVEDQYKYEYDISRYANWTGAYTLVNYAKQGPSAAATDSRTIPIDIYATKQINCNPLFYYEPDILFGARDGGFDTGLTTYHSYNSSYDPLIITGWTTNNKALSNGTFESTYTMANAVYEDAVEIAEYLDENSLNLESRYGDIVQCGMDYSDFALGIYYFLQSRLNPASSLISQISKSTYCTGISISSNGTITVTNSCEQEFQEKTRYMQYLDGIADYVEAGNSYGSYGDLKKEVDLVIMDTSVLTNSQKILLNQANVKVVDISGVMPDTVYGTTMQSADNALGTPYFIGLLYEKRLSSYSYGLSEYDYLAYFVKNIYHVNDKDVETVVKEMLRESGGNVCKTFEDRGLTNNYEYYIDSMIEIGTWYYTQTDLGSGIWKAIDDLYADVDPGD